jgi:hypothetical protein
MKISVNALAMLRYIGRLWIEQGFPTAWWFHRAEGDETFPELVALRLIRLTGAGWAQKYMLTDSGRRWILENRGELTPALVQEEPAEREPEKRPIGFRPPGE